MDDNVSDITTSGPSSPTSSSVQLYMPISTAATLVNLENVNDFSNVCRMCASITEYMIPIFTDEGLLNKIPDKINKHLPIKVFENDSLPQVVCYQCANTLLAWHELVKCSVQADSALRAKLNISKWKNTANNETDTKQKQLAQSITVPPDETNAVQSVRDENKTKVKEVIERPEFTLSENGKRYAMCGVCQKSVSLASWARHVRAHRGERRYSCHTCGLAFNDSGNLARHTRALHSDRRPFACATCPKTFSRKSHLEDHEKSHGESRAFVCDVCGKGSKSATALRMHARTHAARRLPCVQCGARFKRRAELRAHVSVHTGERPHACLCGDAFRLRTQLTAHYKLHHAPLTDTRTQQQEHNVQ